jgi:hypothetical protein
LTNLEKSINFFIKKEEKMKKKEKYYFNQEIGAPDEVCLLKRNGIRIGSYYCRKCEHCQFAGEDWVICDIIELATERTKCVTPVDAITSTMKAYDLDKIDRIVSQFPVHILKNGEVVVITSSHGYKFSDGSIAENGASKEAAEKIEVKRTFSQVRERVFESKQYLTPESLLILEKLNNKGNWVLVPFFVVSALHSMGLREDPRFTNIVAYNATAETKRSRPSEKIVDINKWAW